MAFTDFTPMPGMRSSISFGAVFTSTGNCSRCASAQDSFGSTDRSRLPAASVSSSGAVKP